MTEDCLINLKQVMRRTGLSRDGVYRRMKVRTFPKQTHVGSRSLWSEQEVSAWIQARLDEREHDVPIDAPTTGARA